MPEAAEALSRARKSAALQTYGLSEVGILRSTSRSSDSLWVKVGVTASRPGWSTDARDQGEIRDARYLIGQPFTATAGSRRRCRRGRRRILPILGRKSELINVGARRAIRRGGERPSGDGRRGRRIRQGREQPDHGQIVAARVKLRNNENRLRVSQPDVRILP